MSNENEEKLTPFQLARRNFMNQGNNNPPVQPQRIQRSQTISQNPQPKPIQINNAATNESDENLTPFQIARRNMMRANTQSTDQLVLKKTSSTGSMTASTNQKPKEEPEPTIQEPIQQKPIEAPLQQHSNNETNLANESPIQKQSTPVIQRPMMPGQPQHHKLTMPGQPLTQQNQQTQRPAMPAQPIQQEQHLTQQQPEEEPKPLAQEPIQQQPNVNPDPITPQQDQQLQEESKPIEPTIQHQLEPQIQRPVQNQRPMMPGQPIQNQRLMQPGQPQLHQQPNPAVQQPESETQKPMTPDQPLSHQQSPVQLQQSPVQPQQSPVQPQQSPVQPQQSLVQPQQSPVRPQQSPVRPQQSPVQPQQSPVQPQQSPVQLQQSDIKQKPQQTHEEQPLAQPHLNQQEQQAAQIQQLNSSQNLDLQKTSSQPFISNSSSHNFKTLDPRIRNPTGSPIADSKTKTKVGIFKKKKTSSTSPIAAPSQFDFDESQADSNLTPNLLRVESVIQVSSVPSTAASSKEFMKVPDICSIKEDDLYNIRKIKLESYPSSYRFFSLTHTEINSLTWLNYLKDRPTDNFIFPGEFAQMQPIEMQCHSEFDCQDYEPDNDSVVSPSSFLSEFDNPSSAEFKSNPFIDLNAKSVINSITFPYTREESRMGFLHLKNIYMDQASAERFGMQLSIHGFVYTDKVVTETFLVKMSKDFTGCNGFLSSMNAPNGTESIIIPYPLNQPAYLVISLILDDATCEESPGSSFAFGKYLLPKDKLPEKIEFEFVAGMANDKLVNIINEKPNIPMKFIGEAELVESPVPQSTLRLAAFSNMMPTPVFSMYDVSVKMNLKISSSKDKVCYSMKIKKLIPDNKNSEPREVCGFLDLKTGKFTDLAYSGLRDYSENIFFQEPMNFILDGSIVDPIEIQVTFYTLKKKKLSPIMISKFQIKNSEQRHVNKMEVKGSLIADMKSAFSKQDNMFSCSTLYPALVCPNATLRSSFSSPINEPILTDPMFKNISIYRIQKFLNVSDIPRSSFYELFDCLRMSNMSEIQSWIDHFFCPEKGFSNAYITRLIDSLDIIKDWPQPFFSIALKGICSENNLLEVERLLNAIVHCKHETIKKSAGDIILQLPMFFDVKISHKIAFKFINQLNTADRLYIFKYIFSDILYVESLTYLNFQIEGKKPRSPYVPLLSLFYTTIMNAFVENNEESVGAASFTLSVLATTLELYLDYESARHVAIILFPLISIIFTYYDSLSQKLLKKNSLLPVLLFIMKYSDNNQFMQYYQLLSSDNKPRFFEFLTILFDNAMVNTPTINENEESIVKGKETNVDKNKSLKMTDVARSTFFFNENPLNCVYEITCRFMVFLSHFESDTDCDEQIKTSIITLLLHMLSPMIQPSESYGMLYKTLSSFIKIFIDSVYIKETGIINQLFASIIPLTQRKLLLVRMESIGFILWLTEKEKHYRESMSRCNLALQYAVCNSVFELNQVYCYPFWKYLHSEGNSIRVLYESLVQSISDPLIEKKIMKLLNLYNEYRNFPSIRGRIYLKIVDINIQAKNMFSAFVTQWKFCGFLAEVLKLQKVVIPGIPTNGYKDFPFIVDELPIDLSVYPPDSAYLVTKSDLFTPESVEKALIKAFKLAMSANLYWLVGDITQFIFDSLECQRKYLILNELYNQVSQSYQKMLENDQPRIEFARIFVKGKSAEKLGFTDAIRAFPLNGFMNYIEALFKQLEGVGNVDIDIEPRFESKKENVCSIVQVYPVINEVLGLNARTFTCDVSQDYKNWNDIMIKRHTFHTEMPLPNSIPTVKVARNEALNITKKDYYIEKLTKLRDDLAHNTSLMKSVIPPKDMIEHWKQYMSGLSPKILINLINKVFDDKDKNNYIYNIVYILKNYDPSFSMAPLDPALQSAPEEILDLCNDIWQLMIDAVPVIETLIYLSTDPETEKEKMKIAFLKYRRKLGRPLV